MAIPITPGEMFDYVLEADRELPPEEQTVFELKPMPARQRARLDDMGSSAVLRDDGKGPKISMNGGTKVYETLRACLVGWRNFGDAEFKQDKLLNVLGVQMRPPTDLTLDRLSPNDASELFIACQEHLTVSVAEGKG